MNPQEYTIRSFKASAFLDNYGNTWCDLSLEGIGEPMKIVVKDPAKFKAGDTIYGHTEEMVSKAGRPYLRFKTDKREDYQKPSYTESPEKQDSIYRSVSLNNAAVLYQGQAPDPEIVLMAANEFLAWLKEEKPKEEAAEEVNISGIPFN